MKAYRVRDEARDEDYSTVVYAETPGKARMRALRTEACEDAEFTDISARRIPRLDRFYHGNAELDWMNPKDRIVLVRYGGFRCSDEVLDVFELECPYCDAKKWCDKYKDYMKEMRDEETTKGS